MARKSKQAEQQIDSFMPARVMEALGICMMVGAVALCFALFSFDPSGDRRNLVGPVGDVIADAVLGGVGVIGYLASVVAFVLAGAAVLGRLQLPSIVTMFSGVAFTLGSTIFAHLAWAASRPLGHMAGGNVGAVVAEYLKSFIGPVGAGLGAAALILVSLMGLSRISFAAVAGEALGTLWAWVRYGLGLLRIRQVAEAHAANREEELVQAARSQRAQAKIRLEERERALREKLEEKTRAAVLKAAAKAEEKALARIAKEEAEARVADEAANARTDVEAANGEISEEDPLAVLERGALDVVEGAGPEIIDRRTKGADLEGVSADDGEEYDDDGEEYDEDGEEYDEDGEEYDEDGEEYDEEDEEYDGEDEEYDEEDEEYDEEDEEYDEDDEEEDDEGRDSADIIDEIDNAVSAAKPRRGARAKADGPEIVERELEEANFDGEDESECVSTIDEETHEKVVYQLPPVNLLDYDGDPPEPVDPAILRKRATRLEEKLKTYGVEGKVVAIRPGPVVTTYEYLPAPGVKVSKIANLADDIAMSMEALRVRIVAPVPGRGVVGIELPNKGRENVYLKELIAHDSFKESESLLTMAMGKDAEGEVQTENLQKMPHLLIAGTTGSGKSVSINTMILSILYKATPDQVKFIMVDPKMLELSLYEDIPHLLLPVVTDPRKASLALQWAVDEMERRYQLLSDMKVRSVEGFNKRLERLRQVRDGEVVDEKVFDPWPEEEKLPEHLPYIVVLIDEFADLMCVAPRDVEMSVQRLAQKARAAGIHVLLATQRPSTDVITGVIKNNFPTRVSFRVGSRHDSSTILNSPGAENLLGMGDSLFLGVSSPTPRRIHGGYVSEDEVERVVDFWKAQAKPKYDENILKKREGDEVEGAGREDADEMYDQAVAIVAKTRKASISAIQRKLRIGYNRAARIVDMMEEEGVVSAPQGPKAEREVLVPEISD